MNPYNNYNMGMNNFYPNQFSTLTQPQMSTQNLIRVNGIDGAKAYQMSANSTAQTQKVLDAIQQNKIDSLQAQVNQLQLQSAMCGVVRYPNATTYTAGMNPYWNQSCCNNGCNI